ncbi:MAG: hypothetical protein FD122_1354 [Stygiobacter sp.]|nr:MAG: hypothetical protein FD122_1354 [Stygiobacter sp.]
MEKYPLQCISYCADYMPRIDNSDLNELLKEAAKKPSEKDPHSKKESRWNKFWRLVSPRRN